MARNDEGDLRTPAAFIDRVASLRLTGRRLRWVLGVAAVAFAVGFVVSMQATELSLADVDVVSLVAVLLLGVPLMTLANAEEYRVSARLVGVEVRRATALRISILATAANLLPLPGGPLVRIKALIDDGSRTRRAIQSTALMGAAWLATSLIIAGVFGGLRAGLAVSLVVPGLLLALVCVYLIRGILGPVGWDGAGWIVAVEVGATLATGLRLLLVARALGFAIGSGALVLGIAPVLAALVVVVPAGLGVREGVASLAAPAIGLSAASGFLIAAVDRLAGMAVHGVAAAAVSVFWADVEDREET